MWLLLRGLTLAVLLVGQVTVSWPATEWRGESDLHYHHGGRYKRQEADLVAPAEVAETPLETGSGIHGEESGALEDGSFEGSAGYTVGSDESGGGKESSGGSADPEESSAEGGSTLEHSGHREDDASGPNFNVVTEESGDFEGNQDSSGIHPESRGDKIENGNHPGGSGDDNSEEDIAVVEKVAVEAGAVTGAVYVEAESVPAGEGSGDGTAESQAVAHFNVVAEESGDYEGNQDSSGNHSESSGVKMENGNHPAGGGDDNSKENIDVVEEVAVEAGAVTGEVHIEAESVPAGEGSGDGSTESQAVAQMDVGNQTEESQTMDDVLHDVEDVDEDVAENIDNVGSDFATNTTEGDNLEYEDEHNSVGEDKELETSLESPAGTGSEAIFMLHLRFA